MAVRDFSARENTFNDYRESVADDFGANDEATAAQLQETDKRYADSPTGRDRDRPHEAIVNKDEKGRVTEINSEYMDMMLEKYLSGVLVAERQLEERKCSGGWLGRVGRFFNETTPGKIIKTGTKVLGGVGLSVAATFGSFGIGSPMALALASRTAADGIGEFAQYFGVGALGIKGERHALQEIRDAKNRRAQQILNLMNIRNRIHNDNDRKVEMTGDGEGGPTSLNAELTEIIQALDIIEGEIRQGESNLAHIRSLGRTLRMVASTAVSGGIVGGMLAHGGLSMGVQHFGGSGHEVKMFSNGVHFMYHNAGEISDALAQKGAILHTFPHMHGGVVEMSHVLGSNAPWAEIYGAGMGTAGAVLGTAAYELSDAAKQAGISRNPGARPVFTLRGRTEAGNASNEISGQGPSDSEAVNEDKKGTIEAIREQLVAGSVWEWTSGNGKQVVEIISSEEGKIKFYFLNENGERVGNTVNEYSGEEKIRNGKKIASSTEEFKEIGSVDETVRNVAKEYHVKVPRVGEKWRPRIGHTDAKLIPAGISGDLGITEAIGLSQGDTVILEKFGDKYKTAHILIKDAKGKPTHELVVSTESIVRNCVPKDGGIISAAEGETVSSVEEEGEKDKLEELNQKLREARVSDQLEKDQIYIIGSKWYVIGEINPISGSIVLWAGDGKVPDDKDLKKPEYRSAIKFEEFEAKISGSKKAKYLGKVSAPQQKQQEQKGQKGGGGEKSA